MVEPSLFLRTQNHPGGGAAMRLAEAIARRVGA
jgi:hypothetical protein